MAAALATLEIAECEPLIPHLERIGQRFRQGITEQAQGHRVKLRQSGPPAQMPLICSTTIRYDKGIAFSAAALRRGPPALHPPPPGAPCDVWP